MKARIAVLASGNGSNLQAILDHFVALGDAARGEVVLVASNRENAGALDRARRAHIATATFDARCDEELPCILAAHDIQIVALAGYLRLVPATVIATYRGRILNVHPGPLPRFGGPGMYGRHVHRAILSAGLRETAVTVHLVTEQYDEGPPLAMWPVPVLVDDTPDSLAARVLSFEHLIFPRILDVLAATVEQPRARTE